MAVTRLETFWLIFFLGEGGNDDGSECGHHESSVFYMPVSLVGCLCTSMLTLIAMIL